MPNKKIAVIGAGWSGLAAAIRATELGNRVTLIESAKTAGGRARTVHLPNQVEVDNGQHLLIGAYKTCQQLFKTVGVPVDSFKVVPFQMIATDGFKLKLSNLPAPLHLALGLLFAKGISLKEKWQLIGLIEGIKSSGFTLKQDVPFLNWLKIQGQSLSVIEKLWEPLCLAALNTPIAQASSQLMLNVLKESLMADPSASNMWIASENLSALFPERALAWLEQQGCKIHLGQSAKQISLLGKGYLVDTEVFDQVILACPAFRTSSLLANLGITPEEAMQFDGFQYQPIYSIYCQYEKNVALSHPIQLMSQGFGQWVFDRGHIAGQKGLICVIVSAEGEHESRMNDELAALIVQDLHQYLGLPKAAKWTQVIAEKRATFSAVAGLVRPETQTRWPGVFLAGDYVNNPYPATLEGAVRNGIAAAEAIHEAHNKEAIC